MRDLLWCVVTFSVTAGCATLAEGGGGDENLPNANAGPFREIRSNELGNSRVAPNAMADDRTFSRDVSVVDIDGDPETLEVAGYFARIAQENEDSATPDTPTQVIVRHGAEDGRSFDRNPTVVLEASLDWEEGVIASPSVVLSEDQFWMYYATPSGIGLARSSDGVSFTKEEEPVLTASSGWEENTVPSSPSVVQLSDGSWRMFYQVGMIGIGEASSTDGVTWTRVVNEAVLLPTELGSMEDAYDDVAVETPFAMIQESSVGNRILRLYYTGTNQEDKRVIALASRFEDESEFERATSPVFGSGTSLRPTEPCVVAFQEFTLVFATQLESLFSESGTQAVGAGVAPGNISLPAPIPE